MLLLKTGLPQVSQTILFIIVVAAAAENWSPADGRADTLAAAAAAAENGSYAHGTWP